MKTLKLAIDGPDNNTQRTYHTCCRLLYDWFSLELSSCRLSSPGVQHCSLPARQRERDRWINLLISLMVHLYACRVLLIRNMQHQSSADKHFVNRYNLSQSLVQSNLFKSVLAE